MGTCPSSGLSVGLSANVRNPVRPAGSLHRSCDNAPRTCTPTQSKSPDMTTLDRHRAVPAYNPRMLTRRPWQEELAIIDRTMKAISGVSDPEELVETFWKNIHDLLSVDDYISLSRRGVEPPDYLITRSSRFARPPIESGDPTRQRSSAMAHRIEPLYVGTNRFIVAIDPRTGEELWRAKLDADRGVVALLIRDRYLFAGCSGYVYCLNRHDGAILWKNTLPRTGYDSVVLLMEGATNAPLDVLIAADKRKRGEQAGAAGAAFVATGS